MRWWEYLSRFDFKIEYIKGESNKVADSLSCYYMSDRPNETHDISEYVNADSRLDPEGYDLPNSRREELVSMRATLQPQKPREKEAPDIIEPRIVEAVELCKNSEVPKARWDTEPYPRINDVLSVFESKYLEDRFFSEMWKSPDRHS